MYFLVHAVAYYNLIVSQWDGNCVQTVMNCSPWAASTALTKSCTVYTCPLQPFLQPHRKSSLQASDASDRVVHVILNPVLFQPHSVINLVTEALDPTVTSLVAALLVCWMSAACTGSFLAWFIPSFVLVRSYSRTTNRSSGYIHSPMARGSFQSVVAACWSCQCKDVTTTVHILALYMLKHNCWHQ